MNPIEAQQLTRMLNGRRIVDQIDLIIAAGEIVVLFGVNGAGKTTLVRCLTGSLRPTTGQVLWFGVSSAHRPAAHRQLGFASHESLVYPELSARENLLFAARMYGVTRPDERVALLLETSGLGKWGEHAAARLSTGLRQRLSIARALIHDPPIVIMDEPFAGLDREGRQRLERSLAALRDHGRAICITGHDEEQCGRIADRQFELSGGALHSRGKHVKCFLSRSA